MNLNLEFSGNVIRAIGLNESGEIVLKEELSLSFNLNDEQVTRKNKEDLTAEFEESMNRMLEEEEDREVKPAGILIGTGQTFLNVSPVDFNEDAGSITSHILWELSNYYPDNYKDFNIKYYRLNNNYLSDNIDDVLLIAINRKKIEFIKQLCDSGNIKVKNVEIDHFAVEKCLKEHYGNEINNKTILITGCKNGRLDYSLIVNGSMKYYNYDLTERSDYRNLLISQMNILNSSAHIPERYYLYGDGSTADVRDFLETQFHIPVSIISYSGRNEDSAFAPLYGLALKNLT